MNVQESAPSVSGKINKHPAENPCFEIWEFADSGHKALHAAKCFSVGEVLVYFTARETMTNPSRHSLQVNHTDHILLEPEYLQYMNHSCLPNIIIDVRDMSVRAIEPVRAGDELTFFYPSTEWAMANGFACQCGSSRCLEYIQGAAHIPAETLRNYHLADHIEEKLHEALHPGRRTEAPEK